MKTNSSDISVNQLYRPHINPSSTLPQVYNWAYENYSFTISVARAFMEIYRVTNRFFFCQLTIKSSHWSFRLHIRVCAYVDFEFFISFCCFCVSSELMHVRLNDVCRFLSRTMNWEWWQVMGTYWFTGNKQMDEFILF